jgi:hypothetical protein
VLRVRFVSELGLGEAGIDHNGVFKVRAACASSCCRVAPRPAPSGAGLRPVRSGSGPLRHAACACDALRIALPCSGPAATSCDILRPVRPLLVRRCATARPCGDARAAKLFAKPLSAVCELWREAESQSTRPATEWRHT